MTAFIYLHGYNSGFDPENPKVKAFASLGIVHGRTTNYLDSADVDKLGSFIKKLITDASVKDELVLLGTSLGGYFAQYFAYMYCLRSIIVNPATAPAESLKRATGRNTNFFTGEEYDVTETQVITLQKYFTAPSKNGTLVILATDDELLDYRVAQAAFKDTAHVVLTDGGHRLNDLSKVLSEISRFVNSIPVDAHLDDFAC